MKQSIIFLTLLFSLIFSVAYAQTAKVEHPLPINGKDCAVCHAPGSTEETPADSAAYQEWESSMHGLNSVNVLHAMGKNLHLKQILILIYVYRATHRKQQLLIKK